MRRMPSLRGIDGIYLLIDVVDSPDLTTKLTILPVQGYRWDFLRVGEGVAKATPTPGFRVS